MKFSIKLAISQEEKEAIYRFRYRIYIEELNKTHINADHNRRLLYDEGDEDATLYYALNDDKKIVGTVRGIDGTKKIPAEIIDLFGINTFEQSFALGELAVVDRLMVDSDYRNLRLGHELMVATFVEGLRIGTKVGFLICDEALLPVYLHYGWLSYGKPLRLSNGKMRYRLLCFLQDRRHLKKVRSPLFNYIPADVDDKGVAAERTTKLLGYKPIAPRLSFFQNVSALLIRTYFMLPDKKPLRVKSQKIFFSSGCLLPGWKPWS